MCTMRYFIVQWMQFYCQSLPYIHHPQRVLYNWRQIVIFFEVTCRSKNDGRWEPSSKDFTPYQKRLKTSYPGVSKTATITMAKFHHKKLQNVAQEGRQETADSWELRLPLAKDCLTTKIQCYKCRKMDHMVKTCKLQAYNNDHNRANHIDKNEHPTPGGIQSRGLDYSKRVMTTKKQEIENNWSSRI